MPPDAPGGPDADPLPTDTVTARDPAGDGDHPVSTATVTIPGSLPGRTLPSTVFTPDGAPAPLPLVIISPGFQMDRAQYTSYARHLATWGFAVVLADYADRSLFPNHSRMADDLSAVIDWALEPPLSVDASRIAAAGHSLGGKLSVFAASQDPRIAAIVAWDPVDGGNPSVVPERMATVTAAIAVIGETTNASGGGMPCAPAAENFQQFHAASPSPAISVTVNGADHMDWVDDPSCGLCGFCTPGTASAELARTTTLRLDVVWLRRQLFEDTAMDVWLDAPPELATGELEISRR
jgi:predicted dienelactone hydrolase